MIIKKVTQDAGTNWTRSNDTAHSWACQCVTPTGRIIAGASASSGIWYSDDNGINWTQSNKTSGKWASLCVTLTGRVIAGASSNTGIWYSDDNGINWTQSNKTSGKCFSLCIKASIGRIYAGTDSSIWYSDNNGGNWTKITGNVDVSTNWLSLCVTSTGVVLAGSSNYGLWRTSDDIYWGCASATQTPWAALCITHTGRILAGKNTGIIICDDNIGGSWSLRLDGPSISALCTTPTRRIIATGSSGDNGFYYSDDNGEHWAHSNKNDGNFACLCTTPTGRVLAGSSEGLGTWYSDQVIEATTTKYLDEKGAQELVTQAKNYVNSLVQ